MDLLPPLKHMLHAEMLVSQATSSRPAPLPQVVFIPLLESLAACRLAPPDLQVDVSSILQYQD
jgi:hypothetical protein